jgi:hypothetical protein
LENTSRPLFARDLDVRLVVDKYGVHDDPIFDFIAGEKKLGELTPMIISWCRDAFSADPRAQLRFFQLSHRDVGSIRYVVTT